jgi:hypothetical protein
MSSIAQYWTNRARTPITASAAGRSLAKHPAVSYAGYRAPRYVFGVTITTPDLLMPSFWHVS